MPLFDKKLLKCKKTTTVLAIAFFIFTPPTFYLVTICLSPFAYLVNPLTLAILPSFIA